MYEVVVVVDFFALWTVVVFLPTNRNIEFSGAGKSYMNVENQRKKRSDKSDAPHAKR